MMYRHIGFLVLTLALLISACSQAPVGPNEAGLEPQFGTAADDVAVDVSVQASLGHVYTAGNFGDQAFLRQTKRDGSLGWERRVSKTSRALATGVDGSGNSYLAWEELGEICNQYGTCYLGRVGASVSKYSPSGTLRWTKAFPDLLSMDVDASGTLYLGGQNSVRKHTAAGALVWERKPSNQGAGMTNIVVSAKGNVVAASSNGMIVKYDGSGKQLFRTVRNFGSRGADNLALGPNEEIAASYQRDTSEGTVFFSGLRVFSPDGSSLWQDEVVRGGSSGGSPGVAFDANGDVYFTTTHFACDGGFDLGEPGEGVTCLGGADTDPERSAILVRRYAPAGVPIWSRVFNKGRAGTDDSVGLAAPSSAELYVVGKTESAVNGQQFGGTDAFLLRLNEQGRRVWSR